MSHTLTAGLRQALLSRGFLIAFTGVVVVFFEHLLQWLDVAGVPFAVKARFGRWHEIAYSTVRER